MRTIGAGDRAEFRALVDELAELEARRTGSGGHLPEDAARVQQVERRLLQLVTTAIPHDERRRHVRLPCDLWVNLHVGGRDERGLVVDVGAGGVFVETPQAHAPGTLIDLEMERRPGSLEQRLRVRGKVAWAATTRRTGRAGLGIAFVAPDDAAEHGLRRFVIELLRKRLPDA